MSIDLTAIKARVAATSPAPWVPWAHEIEHVIVDANEDVVAGNYDYEQGGIVNENDLTFIVHAREDIPALISEVERLRERVEALSAEVRRRSHPVVKAVADLVDAVNEQYRRAEAAHDLKDEANRRWLDAVTAGHEPARVDAVPGRPLPAGVEGHDPHAWTDGAVTA